MLDLKRRVGTVARTALAAVRAFVARDDVTYAASLAFYTSLSFGPMVILMLTLTGAVGPELQKRFVEQLGTLIGPEADRALHLVIDDDGPGIAEADRAKVLQRGGRADEATPGHGLGLSMVHDNVELYGGALRIDRSGFGGARIDLRLPGRAGS